MRLIVTGHKQHGKDTVCEILQKKFGTSFVSSSMRACEVFLFDQLKDKYGYVTIEECFEDRIYHRQEWYEAIKEYNKDDKCRLGKEIFSTSDIYCGLRNVEELNEMKKQRLVDHVIWVDASDRCNPEGKESINITKEDCDFTLNNNGGLLELAKNVECLILHLWSLEPKIKISIPSGGRSTNLQVKTQSGKDILKRMFDIGLPVIGFTLSVGVDRINHLTLEVEMTEEVQIELPESLVRVVKLE